MDVTPLSLGIQTTGRVMSTVVKRNTAIPCRKHDTFTTEEDNQTEVDIVVFEERASTDACNELGQFTIGGIQRASEPQIVVTFDIDANGISVTATDKATGVKNSIVITSTQSRNTKEDVERMVADGERFAKEDAKLQRKARRPRARGRHLRPRRRRRRLRQGQGRGRARRGVAAVQLRPPLRAGPQEQDRRAPQLAAA